MLAMEYYCAIRNDKQDDFRKSSEDLQELMQNEISRTGRTLYTITAILDDYL